MDIRAARKNWLGTQNVISIWRDPVRHVVALLLVALVLAASASSNGTPSPMSTQVVDGFAGAISSTELDFTTSTENASLSFEVPRGANVVSAGLRLEGVPEAVPDYDVLDFSVGKLGTDVGAWYMDNMRKNPPSMAPGNSDWKVAGKNDIIGVQASDDKYWRTVTPGESLPPPLEWPVHMFEFSRRADADTQLEVTWEGYSKCQANKTNAFHAEMWLFNHSSDDWKKVAQYGSPLSGDVNLTHRLAGDSDYLNATGSLFVAIVGIHAEGSIAPPKPLSDYGHLYTDYVSVGYADTSLSAYPSDLALTIGQTEVLATSGDFVGPLSLGDTDTMRSAVQACIDNQPVMPGNLSINLSFSVGELTPSRVNVSNLRIEFEPFSNSAPVWDGPDEVGVEEDSLWSEVLDLDLVFSDDANDSLLEFEVTRVSDPSNLSVRIVQDVVYVDHLEVLPSPDFFGRVSVELAAVDLFGATTTATMDVVVEQVGDAPVIQDPGELVVEQGDTLDVTIEAVDVDMPSDEVTFSDSSDLVDVDAATGRILWVTGPLDVGRHHLTVTATDSFGLTDSVTLDIEVTNVNDPPEIVSDLAIWATEDQEEVYQILVDDPDLPHGDSLVHFAFNSTMDLRCEVYTGVLTFTPLNEHVPVVEITLRVRDSLGVTVEEVLTVMVANVNDPPLIQQLHPDTVVEGDEVNVSLSFDDPDLHVPFSNPLEREHLTLSHTGDDVFAPDDDGLVHFNATLALVGIHHVTYTVTDKHGVSDTTEVTWLVIEGNLPPRVVSEVHDMVIAVEDLPFTMSLEATDPNGDGVTWSDSCPLFDIDPVDGTISWTPGQEHLGEHPVELTVADERGATASVHFVLSVQGRNDAPVLLFVLPRNGTLFDEDESVRLEASATDEDGDDLAFTWFDGEEALGNGAELDAGPLSPGRHTIRLIVSDGTVQVEHLVDIEVRDDGPIPTTTIGAVLAAAVIAALATLLATRLTGRRRDVGNPKEHHLSSSGAAGNDGTGYTARDPDDRTSEGDTGPHGGGT